MKRNLLILIAIFAASVVIQAKEVKVFMKDGKVVQGELITCDESLLVVEPNSFVKYEKKIYPENVDYFEIEGIGRVNSIDGVFVYEEKAQAQAQQASALPNKSMENPNDFWTRVLSEKSLPKQQTQPSNPNKVIGRALSTTGGVALGIGLPCLAVGLATCIGGNVGITEKNVKQKADCVEASYYLFGVGASLTIVSIPLIVYGKRVANMEFSYTGNGVGTTLNF